MNKIDPKNFHHAQLTNEYFETLYESVKCGDCEKMRNIYIKLEVLTSDSLSLTMGCIDHYDVIGLRCGKMLPSTLGANFKRIINCNASSCDGLLEISREAVMRIINDISIVVSSPDPSAPILLLKSTVRKPLLNEGYILDNNAQTKVEAKTETPKETPKNNTKEKTNEKQVSSFQQRTSTDRGDRYRPEPKDRDHDRARDRDYDRVRDRDCDRTRARDYERDRDHERGRKRSPERDYRADYKRGRTDPSYERATAYLTEKPFVAYGYPADPYYNYYQSFQDPLPRIAHRDVYIPEKRYNESRDRSNSPVRNEGFVKNAFEYSYNSEREHTRASTTSPDSPTESTLNSEYQSYITQTVGLIGGHHVANLGLRVIPGRGVLLQTDRSHLY